MKKLAIAIAAIALIGTPAFAADMAVKMPVKAPPPPPAPVYSWTGFYVGANGGYGWGSTSGDLVSTDPLTALPLSFGFAPSYASSFHQSGGIVGGQVGYNSQLSQIWVAGVEADIQYAHIAGSSFHTVFQSPAQFGNNFPLDVSTERKLDWFGTIRGRLGVLASPSLLIYGTGGFAYGNTKASGSVTLRGPPGGGENFFLSSTGCIAEIPASTFPASNTCYAGSDSRTTIGWAAGAGIEYHLFNNLTAKLEYLHLDLGNQTVTLASTTTPGVFMGYGFNHEQVNMIRAGLNYQFH
jgi:outer membrane immunogenic protein